MPKRDYEGMPAIEAGLVQQKCCTLNCILSGFCGGLGEYFDVDPILIRLGFIALFLLTGIGPAFIALYLIGAIFTPLEPK